MEALIIDGFDHGFKETGVRNVPVPVAAMGEVLIEVEYSAIIPADFLTLRGAYLQERTPPFIAGLIGIGKVVGSGGGLMGAMLKGRRVFFSPGPTRGGTWAKFATAATLDCLPVGHLSPATAMSIGNALTAVALVATARKKGASAAIMNAAAGSLGRLVNRLAKQDGYPIINIVRSHSQADSLHTLGAENVLTEGDENHAQQFATLAAQLSATIAFDSISGAAPGQLMQVMPERSTILGAGNLSNQPVTFDLPKVMMARKQAYEAFVIEDWLNGRALPGKLIAISKAKKLVSSAKNEPTVRMTLSLEETANGLPELEKNTSAGLALINLRI